MSLVRFNPKKVFGSAYQSLVESYEQSPQKIWERKPLIEIKFVWANQKLLIANYYPDEKCGTGLCDLNEGIPPCYGHIQFSDVYKRLRNLQKHPEKTRQPFEDLAPQYRIMRAKHTLGEYAEAAKQANRIIMLPEEESSI